MPSTMISRNSMLYWWPRVHDVDVPMPATCLIEIGRSTLVDYMLEIGCVDGIVPGWDGMVDAEAQAVEARWAEGDELPATDAIVDARGRMWWMAVINAMDDIGYPAFVRGDMAAAKHQWRDTCHVPTSAELQQHIAAIIEDNTLQGLTDSGLALRKYIAPDAEFAAFHGRLPIGRERRLFVDQGRVVCWHPYWPAGAILAPDRDDWEYRLAEANTMSEDEIELLIGYAERIAERLEGYWSLDFMLGADGTWYFIDAALGHDSWHPACEVVDRHPEYDTRVG